MREQAIRLAAAISDAVVPCFGCAQALVDAARRVTAARSLLRREIQNEQLGVRRYGLE
jgi:hypothetical protein